MALAQEEKDQLIRLKQDLQRKRSQPQFKAFNTLIDELDLSFIRPDQLKAITKPQFTVGIDFKSIDTSPPFTTTDMNALAPGSIDVRELKQRLSNQSMLQSRTAELIDTQQGVMLVIEEVLLNADIEDMVVAKSTSQGVNLQMINIAENINAESTSGKDIPSRFVEEN